MEYYFQNSLISQSQIFLACPAIHSYMDQNKIAFCTFDPSETYCFLTDPHHPPSIKIDLAYLKGENFPSFPIYDSSTRTLGIPPSIQLRIDELILKLGKVLVTFGDVELSKSHQLTLDRARLGLVSLAGYEEAKAKREFKASQIFKQIAQNCSSLWHLDFNQKWVSDEFPPSVGSLMVSSFIQGGMSGLKKEWQNFFSKAYCQIHSYDSYSCNSSNFIKYKNFDYKDAEVIADWILNLSAGEVGYSDPIQSEINAYLNQNGAKLVELDVSSNLAATQQMERVKKSFSSLS